MKHLLVVRYVFNIDSFTHSHGYLFKLFLFHLTNDFKLVIRKLSLYFSFIVMLDQLACLRMAEVYIKVDSD